MEIIKTKAGWIDLLTDKHYLFGDIIVEVYNQLSDADTIIYKELRKYYSINAHWFHVIGSKYTECHAESKIFEKDSKIKAIISSEKLLSPAFNMNTYHHDGWNDGKLHFFIPVYQSDLDKIFKNDSPYYTDFVMDIVRKKKFCHFIEHLCDQGEKLYYPEGEYKNTNVRILDTWLIDQEIPTVIRKYENVYYRAFIVEDIYQLLYDDLIQMIDFDYSLEYCPICKKTFIKRDKRMKFCSICSLNEKAKKQYNDKKRKTEPRYIHKNICDMLRNRNESYTDFCKESDYYWDIINHKNASHNTNYNNSIKTKSDYINWLEEKRKAYKKR